MAEALVFVVLQKIATTIAKEVVTPNLFDQVTVLREIRYNIKQIEMELVLMQAFLRRVDVQTSNNQTFELWSEQVKKVAREVEDVIDEYAYLVEKTKHTTSIVKKKLYYLKYASAWNEIATQLKEVKGHIDHLTQMRDRYGITIPHEASNNRNNANRLLNISDYSHWIDESGIVGNQKERSQLIQWLTKTSQDRAVISIWGMGGSGKTTLMTDIYKTEDVKRHFDCFAFVSVSQSFQVEELLRSIIRQIFERDDNITTEFDLMNSKSLMETLYNELNNKRYFIVLDDVWRRDAWIVLSRSFPKNSIGSRIVITTRNEDVAHLAIDTYVIKMRPLTDEEAWELFHKKAFAEQKEKICPPEIMSWAMKIVNKCQGLPLAIVAIGSLLSFRRLEEKEWRIFYNQLSWELSSNSELGWVANVLNLSYDDLPTYLKNCFLYCSLLPEDSIIRMRWITRVLVAEGFVDDSGPDITMEEAAENYLMELVHRSLLEVVERTIYGRAKKFKMHDLVRDICIAKAKKESFGTLCYNKLPTIDGQTRRIFICHPIGNIQPVADSSKLRSFILIQGQSLLPSIEGILSNLKLLRVLCLNGSNIKILPDIIFELFNLHFLDLSRTQVKLIPKSLGKLKLLQSLDLSKTAVKKLPKEACKLSNLRHLFVLSYHDYQEQQYDYFYGVTVPAMICSLKDLQTLCYIEANDEIVQSLGSLVMLRKLSLFNVKRRHIADLWASIAKILFLTHLGVVACDKSEVLNLQFLNPPPGLEKLYLEGILEGGVIPSIFSKFSKLRDLRLGWLGLQEDPLKSFSHMSNLVELHLCAIYKGHTFTFCSGWFPKLQRLSLADMFELVSINIEDGAMLNLHLLELMGLSKLECVPEGMKHLCALKKLILADMPPQFIKNLEMIKTSFSVLHSARKRDVIDAFFFSADVSLMRTNMHISDSPTWIPRLGMEFPTELEAWIFWKYYGGQMGFNVWKWCANKSNIDGATTSSLFVCSSEGKRGKDKRDEQTKNPRAETRTGCMVRLGLKLVREKNQFKVVDFISDHNHLLQKPEACHLLRSQREVPEVALYDIELADETGVRPKQAHELMGRQAGGMSHLTFSMIDHRNVLRDNRQRVLAFGEAVVMLNYFHERVSENPSFQHVEQVDEVQEITNIFWADVKMIVDYARFGEVIVFDTTFGTNKEHRPFGVFDGFNHFREMVILGATLMYDQTADSFEWVFKTFLEVHNHKKPKTIFTDQDIAMGNAITKVMPETTHGLCTWHIMENAGRHSMHYNKSMGILRKLSDCMYVYEEVEEFENVFGELMRNISDETWLPFIHSFKEKWAYCYMKNAVTLGIRSTQMSESINKDLKCYLKSDLSIIRLLKHFERIVNDKREKEVASDFAWREKLPKLKMKVPILKQAGELYTPKIFELFQEEYELSMAAQIEGPNGDEYMVRISAFGDQDITHKCQKVLWNQDDLIVVCGCNKFERVGILCWHALKVLDAKNIKVLPEKYFLKRWTREAEDDVVEDKNGRTVIIDTRLDIARRCRDLCREFSKIAATAAYSEEGAVLTRSVLDTLKKQLREMMSNLSINTDDNQKVSHLPDSSKNNTKLPKLKKKDGKKGSKRKHPWTEDMKKKGKKGTKCCNKSEEQEVKESNSKVLTVQELPQTGYETSPSFVQSSMGYTDVLLSFSCGLDVVPPNQGNNLDMTMLLESHHQGTPPEEHFRTQ